MIFPDGTFVAEGAESFAGSVDGVRGTVDFREVAAGNIATTFQGEAVIVGSTGNLADLRGTIGVSANSANGTLIG